MNRNEGLRSGLRGRLNRLVRRTKGYSKTDGMLTLSIALGMVEIGLDSIHLHVLEVPASIVTTTLSYYNLCHRRGMNFLINCQSHRIDARRRPD